MKLKQTYKETSNLTDFSGRQSFYLNLNEFTGYLDLGKNWSIFICLFGGAEEGIDEALFILVFS